jgi:cytochrome c oxidase subunit II
MTQGKAVYEKNCAVCHQAGGQGMPPAFPALAGSKIVNAPIFDADGKLIKDSHLERVLNGKGMMPAWKGTLGDSDIAAVVTYERNAFGNNMGDLVQPSQIKALR